MIPSTYCATIGLIVLSTLNYRVNSQPAGTVLTLAGNASSGYADGTLLRSTFVEPKSLALGPRGPSGTAAFALLADETSQTIRRLDLESGVITTLAGDPTQPPGYADGRGSQALFNAPTGIAMDAAGVNALVTDHYWSYIRHIDVRTGTVTTLAGGGTPVSNDHADGIGTASCFRGPCGIAMDAAGRIALVVELQNHLLRHIVISSALVTTLAGRPGISGFADGYASGVIFNQPHCVTMDANATFAVIADSSNRLLRLVNLSTGLVTTLAGRFLAPAPSADGQGTSASFYSISCVSMDPAGKFALVTDQWSNLIRYVVISSAIVTTVAGRSGVSGYTDGLGTLATFRNVQCASIDSDASFALVADSGNRVVRKFFIVSISSTASQTSSRSMSPSSTPSSSATSSISSTPSLSQTQTQSLTGSPTPSKSGSALYLMFGTSTSSDSVTRSAVISDSLPSELLNMWVSRCPRLGGFTTLSRSVVSCDVSSEFETTSVRPASQVYYALGTRSAVATSGSVVVLANGLRNASALGSSAPPCDETSASPVLLNVAVWVGALFRSISTPAASLNCQAIDSGTGLMIASASLSLNVVRTAWPLWDDAILVTYAGSMRSARLGGTVNATAALLGVCNSDIVVAGGSALSCPASFSAAIESPVAILTAAMSLWAPISLSNASTPVLSLTLSGASRIMLRASNRTFSPSQTSAILQGVPCNISAVSVDGTWLLLETPTSTQVCGSDTVDCGYVTLTLANSPTPDTRGAALSCPPFCPGVIHNGIRPLANGSSAFTLGLDPPVLEGALPSYLDGAPLTTSMGLYYAASCAQTGLWVDPALGSCDNATDPQSYGCAYRSGAGCFPCPSGALCPGGSRVWPRTGYWTTSETALFVLSCSLPDPMIKCAGWNASSRSMVCGRGYRPGSWLCGGCADTFYPPGDGSCSPCPVVSSVWDRYRTLIAVFLGVLGAACLVGIIIVALIATIGGTFWGSTRRIVDLMQWAVVSLQTVSQAAPAFDSSLPSALTTLFNGLAALQVQGILLPSACTGSYAFQTEVGVMGTAFCTTAITAIGAVSGDKAPKWLVGLAGAAVRMTLVLYPVVSRNALTLLNCNTVSLTRAGAASLDGGGSSSGPQVSAAIVTVQVLASNPLYECWAPGGSHRPAAILAAIVVACIVCGFPLVTLLAAWQHHRRTDQRGIVVVGPASESTDAPATPSPLLVAPFCSDYGPRTWYTRHVDLAFTFLLSALQALAPRPTSPPGIGGKAAVIAIVALALAAHAVVLRPFVPAQSWKGPVRAALLATTAACAAIDAWGTAADFGFVAPSAAGLTAAAVLVVMLFAGTLCLLVAGISGATLRGVREEQAAIEARVAAATSAKSLLARRLRGPGQQGDGDAPACGPDTETDDCALIGDALVPRPVDACQDTTTSCAPIPPTARHRGLLVDAGASDMEGSAMPLSASRHDTLLQRGQAEQRHVGFGIMQSRRNLKHPVRSPSVANNRGSFVSHVNPIHQSTGALQL